MQSKTLNILFVEDSEDDFQLVLRELQKGGLTVAAERVEDIESLKAALETTKWDIVITDYALPGFTGLSALQIIKHKNPDIPVVVVSGSIGEEIAVAAMKAGAQDYVMKDNLKRLTPAVVRELQEFESRKKVKSAEAAFEASEERLRTLFETAEDGIFIKNRNLVYTQVNSAFAKFLHRPANQIIGKTDLELFAKEEGDYIRRIDGRVLQGETIKEDYSNPVQETVRSYHIIKVPLRDKSDNIIGICGFARDITNRKQATAALQESEERYRSLFEEVPISLWEEDFSETKKHLDKLKAKGIDDFGSYFDTHSEEVKYLESLTRIVYINRATIQMFEARSKEELLNNMSRIKTEESTRRFKKEILTLIGGKTSFKVEGVSQTITGKKLYIDVKLNIAPGYEKTWERILISVNNLTEREKMTRAIKESEKQFRAIFEDAPLMINSFDKSGTCQLWNKECTRITGLTMEDVRQKSSILLQFYPDAEERTKAIEHLKKADGSFKEFLLEVDGKPRHQLWANFRLPSGTLISMGHDITERIKNEETIRISEEKYRSLFETSRDGIAFFSLDGTVEDANHAFLNMLGYSLKELRTMSYEQYTPPKWVGFERNIIDNEILQHGYSEEYEKEFTHKDGKIFPVSVRAWLVRDEAGNPLRMLTIVRDLTRQKRTEEKLKFTQFSVERSGDAVYWLNKEGKFIDVNNRACQSLGYTREELLNMTVHDIDPDFPAEVWPQHWQNVKFHGSMTIEAHHRTKKGVVFPVEIQANFLEYNGVEFNCSFVRDITERKRAEQQLMKLSHAVEQSPSLVMITDSEGHIEYVNPKFTATTGYPLEDIKGQNPRFLKSGKTSPEQYKNLWETITSGNVWHGEFQNKKKDGSFYWQSLSISPVKDENGNTINFLAVMEDVTERKKLEEERSQLQAQILQAQKLETIGTLAGGIAHDFNNLLTPILGYSDMALNDADEKSQTFKDLLEINKAAARAKDLVQQILTFSRQLPQEQKPIRIQHIIKEALNLLRATIPSYIEIRQNIDRDCDPVFADATQIHQVIVNLCTNSYHAMREKSGTLTISLKMVDVGIEILQALPNLSVGKYVCLTVSDTGKGMSQATIERIFEPFFTTKTMGEGTGLGLSVVHGIILSHGGDIHVQSKVGVGSIFQVYLPPVKIDKVTHLPRKHPLPKGNERVLFVDDEIAVAEVGNRILTRLGYQVTVKHNATEALECFRQRPTEFDIIITDQTMPKMSGFEFAKEVINIRQNIPVVLISGYNDVIDPETVKSSGIFEYLLKPLNTSDISKVVREALDTKNMKEN